MPKPKRTRVRSSPWSALHGGKDVDPDESFASMLDVVADPEMRKRVIDPGEQREVRKAMRVLKAAGFPVVE